jgi:hypothetical protein
MPRLGGGKKRHKSGALRQFFSFISLRQIGHLLNVLSIAFSNKVSVCKKEQE